MMKQLIFIVLIVTTVSLLSYKIGMINYGFDSERFGWLKGEWKRINGKPSTHTFEIWKENGAVSLSGLGYTMENNDTVFIEYLEIKKGKDDFSLFIQGEYDSIPVEFAITEIGERFFRAENEHNPFPKKIFYQQTDTGLFVEVTNDEYRLTYDFEQINEPQTTE